MLYWCTLVQPLAGSTPFLMLYFTLGKYFYTLKHLSRVSYWCVCVCLRVQVCAREFCVYMRVFVCVLYVCAFVYVCLRVGVSWGSMCLSVHMCMCASGIVDVVSITFRLNKYCLVAIILFI